MIEPELASVTRRIAEQSVQVKRARGDGGSGIIWRQDGLIVTNAHVATTSPVEVELADHRRFPARIVLRDQQRDLAALRISASGLPAARPGNSRALRPGELVIAVGNPLGLVGAASVGVIQSVSDSRWIRTDVRLAPGNSGGPLANAQGEVIGVNSMIVNGLGYAVPAHAVKRFLAGRKGKIGVTLQPVSVKHGAETKLGLLVLEAATSGAAWRAGVRQGDVLVAAGGCGFESVEDLADALDEAQNGVTLEWLRAGRWISAAVAPEFETQRAVA
ncbi:MAG: S1C family serine protease [Bryobacteraceae bacterium]